MYYYGARFYDAYLNRWVSPDNIVPLASQGVQAWDRYAYVNNNPVRYNDPTGHDVGCAGEDLSTCQLEEEDDPATSSELPLLPAPIPIKKPSTYYNASPTITPVPLPYYSSAPTNTPSPLPKYSSTSQSKPSIQIDWSKVDKIDFGVDAAGVILEVGGLAASGLGLPEIGAAAEVAQGVVEGAGLVKSIADVVQGDPNNLFMQQTSTTAQRVTVLIFRAERIAPVIGLVGNAVSLYVNLAPATTINR